MELVILRANDFTKVPRLRRFWFCSERHGHNFSVGITDIEHNEFPFSIHVVQCQLYGDPIPPP
ncbi:MAG: hypothetical protein BWX84_00656 [Verrucomicrobia bacterium ADurb.Bin118]|jgi:hypothetical protein|nr:MAG: hypothetical protein BWX84_00656 [Verrucomicrobia bacterium ADurb.Bin118]